MKKLYREKAINRPVQKFSGKSRTDQSFADSCDINKIVANFMRTGEMPKSSREGFFADTSYIPSDLLSAHEIIKDAHESFMQLPSKTREEFNNDPAQLLDFVQNPANRDKAIELGLIPKPPMDFSIPSIVEKSTTKQQNETPSQVPPKKASTAKTTTINDDE